MQTGKQRYTADEMSAILLQFERFVCENFALGQESPVGPLRIHPQPGGLLAAWTASMSKEAS
jgi:hypothetical protein